jgi:hypothetical protein
VRRSGEWCSIESESSVKVCDVRVYISECREDKQHRGNGDDMSECQNTAVCAFKAQSPRISAFEIHEWIYETMRLQE